MVWTSSNKLISSAIDLAQGTKDRIFVGCEVMHLFCCALACFVSLLCYYGSRLAVLLAVWLRIFIFFLDKSFHEKTCVLTK